MLCSNVLPSQQHATLSFKGNHAELDGGAIWSTEYAVVSLKDITLL